GGGGGRGGDPRVGEGVGGGLRGGGGGGEQRHLPTLHASIEAEGHHRRQQQNEADDRPHLEILLPNHLFIGVGRQHVELPADHLGDAEIGNHEREHDEQRRDQAV